MPEYKIDPYLEELLKQNGYYGNPSESEEELAQAVPVEELEEEELAQAVPVEEEELIEEEPAMEESMNSNPAIRLHMISKNDHYLKQMKLYRNSGIMSGIMCAGSLLSYTYTLPMDSTPSTGMLQSLTIGMSALTFARSVYCFYKKGKYNEKCINVKEKGKVKNKIKEKIAEW